MKRRQAGIRLASATLIASALLATACTSETAESSPRTLQPPPDTVRRADSSPRTYTEISPGSERRALATHEGLFRYGPMGPEGVRTNIDLMGFTIAAPQRYYAGPPHVVMDLP